MILDGRSLSIGTLGQDVGPREYLAALYPKADIPPVAHVALLAEPLIARCNHGLWIASCACGADGLPTPGCIVFPDAPWGWCVRCGNRRHGGCWRTVLVPTPEERARIEAVLLCRPDPATWNWRPGETVADLIAENVAHGVGVPEDVDGLD